MDAALWVAKTGLDAQNSRLQVITNNLANVNTTGFKRSRAVFEDLLYQNMRQPGAQNAQDMLLPSGLQMGTGSRLVSTQKIFQEGPIVTTNVQLDAAINGRGFFQILQPDGTLAYTRDGTFHLDDQGRLVTALGLPLQPEITIPDNAQSIAIGADGTVSVSLPGDPVPDQVGTIQLADFINPAGLQPIGDNLYLETQSSGPPNLGDPAFDGFGAILQGALEQSNVNVVEELVSMIEAQRAYEMSARGIQTVDQMLQFLTQNV